MKAKKGISLIVLVITIIVIIILAAAVLLTLNQNNPIDNANTAVRSSDAAEIKSAMALYISNFMAQTKGLSPFKGGNVTVGSTDHKALPTGADLTTAISDGTISDYQEDVVSWKDLGFKGKPASLQSVSYDSTTGIFTIKASDGTTVE